MVKVSSALSCAENGRDSGLTLEANAPPAADVPSRLVNRHLTTSPFRERTIGQRPAASGQRPAASGQRPAASGQRPAA